MGALLQPGDLVNIRSPAITRLPVAVGLLTCALTGSTQPWTVASPASHGMDAATLEAMTPRLRSGELGQIDGVMVLRGGEVVYQEYFRGYQGQPLPIFSVTKSVGSILMGTLVRDGLLDVSEPINDYFPQYPELRLNELRRQITVEHVLQQRHGHAWEEWPYTDDPNHPIAVMLASPDWMRTTLTWPMAGPPGQEFKYSTGASGLMSGIIRHTTGLRTQEYALRELFEPLGFGAVDWAITGLNQRTVFLDEEDFPDGVAPLGFSLWLGLPDLARIGQMMLDGGVWQEQRIIDQAWIDASIATYSTPLTDPDVFAAPGQGYGYQWWILPMTDQLGRTFDMYYANGYGRQYIFVFPQADMVVAQLAADYTREGPGIGTALREHILPSITADPREFEPMTDRLNGSWYDPAAVGQGLNLEILEDRGEALAYWYTFDTTGNPMWLIGQGPVDSAGVAQLEFLIVTGGQLGVGGEPVLAAWGNGELSFSSCHQGRLLFTSPMAELDGEISLSRLTNAQACVDVQAKHTVP